MRKVLVVLGFVFIFFVSSSSAQEEVNNHEELTDEEVRKVMLDEVGASEEDLDQMPIDVQRNLVEQDAKFLGTEGIKYYPVVSEFGDDFSAQNISGLTMYGSAYTVASDRAGYKKIYLYTRYDWGSGRVLNNIEDGISIGYPVTANFFLPTSGGTVQQFKSTICGEDETGSTRCSTSYSPDSHDVGAGVGKKLNLRHKFYNVNGYTEQYVYTESQNSNTVNVLFRYGHSSLTGSISFEVTTGGLTVYPGWRINEEDYVLTLNY